MRLFFAIAIPDAVGARVAAFRDEVRSQVGDEGVRWSRLENLHLTVRFLGEEPPERALLALEAARVAADRCAPFDLAFGGLGAFPDARRPRALWVGVSRGDAPLTDLATALADALAVRGFVAEARAFRPHVTLARLKDDAAVRPRVASALRASPLGGGFPAPLSGDLAAPLSGDPIAHLRVERIVLFRSEPAADSSRYTSVAELPLVGG